jgi:Zn-dependent metalloprotease
MVTKKTSSTTKAETATVKAEKKETAAAKAIETKKDTTKKLETKAAVLVDTPEVQAEEVKETVKKAAKKVAAKAEDTAEKAVKTVKKAAKKTAAKTTKKAELKTEFFLQFSGKEYTEKEILKKVKDVWTKNLKNKVGDMKDVKIYLKPEESAAYYVVNGDTTGKIDL